MTQGHIRIRPARPSVGLSKIPVSNDSVRPPSQLAVESRMCPKRHLSVEKPLFHLYKSCATLAKQQAMTTDESADTQIYGRVCLA